MFCGNCGSQNPDGAVICTVCGAPLTPEKPAKKAGFDLKSMDRNKLIGLGVIAAVVLVALILILVLVFSGRSDTSTLKQYVKAAIDMDAKKIVNLYPDVHVKIYAEEEDISNSEAKEELIDSLQDELDDAADRYDDIDFDEIKSLKVEIRDEDKATKTEVRKANEMFEEQYDLKLNAKEMKEVTIKITGKYDDDKFNIRVSGIVLVKIGGSWYLFTEDYESIYSALLAEIN